MTILKHELKQNLKNMLVWAFCIALSCFGCLLLYKSLESSLGDMNEMFASMGDFSSAIGMDKVGIDTMEGYYATEIAIIFSLGGAMYAALIGICMLAKEEEGHTAEFLHTFPVSRAHIVLSKYIAMAIMIFLLNVICIVFCYGSFVLLDAPLDKQSFLLYHGLQYFMQLEIATVCFMVSAAAKKKMTGFGLGGAILLYAMDLMCRIIPDIKGLKYITPYYYSNASDIFSTGKAEGVPIIIGGAILLLALAGTFWIYERRDIQ